MNIERYSIGAVSCFFLLCLLSIALNSDVSSADTIRINGSGSGLEMMKPIIEAYIRTHKGVSVIMEKPLGSSGAIKALIDGYIDIAVSSKPLKPEEFARGCRIKYFGITPLAIVAHRDVPKDNITTKELQDIYTGIYQKWSNGENVRVVLRPLDDIDTKILRGLSAGMDEAITKAQKRRGMVMAVTDPESNDAVSRTPGAIGASGLTGLIVGKFPLKVISLNGVKPELKNLAEGRYPLYKELHFIITDRISAPAERFLQYIYSEKGRSIAERAGVLVTATVK